MSHSISVGQLRQNPTQMLREVKAGATYVVTDHGEPVADVSAHRRTRWLPAEELDALLRELAADEAWSQEIAADRGDVDMDDPWLTLG